MPSRTPPAVSSCFHSGTQVGRQVVVASAFCRCSCDGKACSEACLSFHQSQSGVQSASCVRCVAGHNCGGKGLFAKLIAADSADRCDSCNKVACSRTCLHLHRRKSGCTSEAKCQSPGWFARMVRVLSSWLQFCFGLFNCRVVCLDTSACELERYWQACAHIQSPSRRYRPGCQSFRSPKQGNLSSLRCRPAV